MLADQRLRHHYVPVYEDENYSQDDLCLERTRSNTPKYLGREGFDVWCNSWETESKFQMWNFDRITSESRNWSNEELQGREVHAKESHKDNSLSEKAAKKIHEDSLQTPT